MSGQPSRRVSSSAQLVSGAAAAAVQTVFWHPLDLLKTRLQVQDGRLEKGSGLPAYRSLRHAIASVARKEGAIGFLRGVLPSVAGASLAWGLQMPLYAQLKHLASVDPGMQRPLFYFAHREVVCSLLAGALTTVAVHPVFLVKTRMQLQPRTRGGGAVRPDLAQPAYRHSADAVRSIVREEGVAGLYAGFAPSLLLSSHGAVLLVSYDHFKALYPSVLAASFAAKVFATAATYPLQVVRAVMQQRPPADGSFPYATATATVGLLWQRGGAAAFYRGIGPQMLRTVPQAMAFFSIYESALKLLSRLWDS